MADQGIGVEVPSFSARLKYHLLNFPPDERYRSWVENEMHSVWWGVQSVTPVAIGYFIGALIVAVFLPLDNRGGFLLGGAIGLGGVALLQSAVPPWRRWAQSRTMRQYEKRWARNRDKVGVGWDLRK